MALNIGDLAGRRCKPGDLARITYSTNPLLIGRVVFVEKWGQHDRWDVTLIGAPTFGLEFNTGRPVVGYKTAFRDASLCPISEREGCEQGKSVRLEAPVLR
jgi:hypothetical protein